MVDAGDVYEAPFHEVDHPARGGDDEIDPLAHLGDLLVHVGSAVDGEALEAHALGQRLQLGEHLDRQLPGGYEDEGPDPFPLTGGHELHEGNAEREGFA